MHSGVFATSPEAAGDIVASHLLSARGQLRNAEVMDVDEEALRAGRVSARLYGIARVPLDRTRVQHAKAPSPAPDAALDALCRSLAEEARSGGLTLFGPGTTTARALSHLGVEGTLLGVDAVENGELVGADLNEAQLLELLDGRSARLVVAVVGGQGYVFGRGNQQLSAEVIRRVGLDNLEVVAALDKVLALDPATLRVDTGDPELDGELCGHRRVRVAPNRFLVLAVST
jgi:predicted polyphosphate/ATP-dependent NAD kinase